ncbi:MAG TPA: hypothetical protein VF530_19845 [Planctomycetota bacterium]
MRLLFAALFFCAVPIALMAALDSVIDLESGSPWLKPGVLAAFAADTALTWWLFHDRRARASSRRLRALQRSVEQGGRLEPDPALDFRFAFTSTQRDLLDAERVHRGERTGMRGWVRASVVGVGLMFLAGFVFFGLPDILRGRIGLAPFVWLGMGSLLLWFFLVKPLRARRGIRREAPAAQELTLHLTPRGIDCDVAGVGRFLRRWCEIERFVPARKGVLLEFRDVVNWLPARVFADRAERARFESGVATRLAQETVRFQAGPVLHPVVAELEGYGLSELRHEPGTEATGATLELTFLRDGTERRLRLDRPLLATFDEEGLEQGSRDVLVVQVPHPELDGLSVRVLDGEGHLDLFAEGLVDLGERRAG